MPLPPPTRPDDRRVAASRARLQRTLRVVRLRRQVLAGAFATFALAFGLVAFDGSMGKATTSSAALPSSGTAVSGSSQQRTTDDFEARTPAESLPSDDGFDQSAVAPGPPASTSQS